MATAALDTRQVLVKTLLLLLAPGLLFRELTLPAPGLDSSCMLAQQYGFLNGIDFGRYLTNTYGLLSFLTSGLFHPKTFYLSILFQVLCVSIVLWPVINVRWSARFVFLMLLCLVCDQLNYLNDGFVFAAMFSAFMLSVLDRRVAAPVAAAIIGVLSLSKWSFLFVALPLFALADIHSVMMKRLLPQQSLTLLATVALVWVLSGQPIGSLPSYIRNGYEISSFFAAAVSQPLWLPAATKLTFLIVAGALVLLLLLHVRKALTEGHSPSAPKTVTPLVLALGLLWLLFALNKASFIRPDGGHYFIGWHTLLLILPVTLLVTASVLRDARLGRLDVAMIVVACAVFFLVVDYPPIWQHPQELPARVNERLTRKFQGVTYLLGWADARKVKGWRQARMQALYSMAASGTGMGIGRETVDVYPWNLSPVIAAGLTYQPRPTMQAQVAYSPHLQELDLEHWRGPNAPAHLLFELGDIDNRLPTMALGPSIVELLSRYEPVGRVGSSLQLRRRQTTRPVVQGATSLAPIAIDQWIDVPNTIGSLTLARIRLTPTIGGRLLAFIDKPPILEIEVRFSTGGKRLYRFIPSMAELGFAISPELVSLLGANSRPEPDLIGGLRRSVPVHAFKIREFDDGRLAQYWLSQAEVTFSLVQIQ
jgi:hypothetical protein